MSEERHRSPFPPRACSRSRTRASVIVSRFSIQAHDDSMATQSACHCSTGRAGGQTRERTWAIDDASGSGRKGHRRSDAESSAPVPNRRQVHGSDWSRPSWASSSSASGGSGAGALARRRTRLPGLVALGLLHRRHRRTPRRAPGTRAPGRGVELPSLGRLPRRHARERRLRRPPLRSPGNRRCASRAHSRQRGAPGGRPPHRPRLVGARDAARRRVLRVHLPAPDIGSHVGRKSGLTRSGVPPPGRGPSTW